MVDRAYYLRSDLSMSIVHRALRAWYKVTQVSGKIAFAGMALLELAASRLLGWWWIVAHIPSQLLQASFTRVWRWHKYRVLRWAVWRWRSAGCLVACLIGVWRRKALLDRLPEQRWGRWRQQRMALGLYDWWQRCITKRRAKLASSVATLREHCSQMQQEHKRTQTIQAEHSVKVAVVEQWRHQARWRSRQLLFLRVVYVRNYTRGLAAIGAAAENMRAMEAAITWNREHLLVESVRQSFVIWLDWAALFHWFGASCIRRAVHTHSTHSSAMALQTWRSLTYQASAMQSAKRLCKLRGWQQWSTALRCDLWARLGRIARWRGLLACERWGWRHWVHSMNQKHPDDSTKPSWDSPLPDPGYSIPNQSRAQSLHGDAARAIKPRNRLSRGTRSAAALLRSRNVLAVSKSLKVSQLISSRPNNYQMARGHSSLN